MEIGIAKVPGTTTKEIPKEGVTVYDDFDIKVKKIVSIAIYQRDKEDCPFNRGNWIIDIVFRDTGPFCIRLPYEMEDKHVYEYCKPLIDELNELLKKHIH